MLKNQLGAENNNEPVHLRYWKRMEKNVIYMSLECREGADIHATRTCSRTLFLKMTKLLFLNYFVAIVVGDCGFRNFLSQNVIFQVSQFGDQWN